MPGQTVELASVPRRGLEAAREWVVSLQVPTPIERSVALRGLWKPLLAFALARCLVMTVWSIQGSLRGAIGGWDGGWYASVVDLGYSPTPPVGVDSGQANIAFFPGYPMAARGVSWLTGFTTFQSLLVVALVAGAVATCLVWLLTMSLYGERSADRACLLFAFAPGAFAFSMLYSEPMFVAFGVAACWALATRRYLVGGAMAGLAAVTRPTGVALIAACVVAVVLAERADRVRAVAGAAISTVGVSLYFVFLHHLSGSWTVYFDVQREGWGERSTLYEARKADVMASLRAAIGSQPPNWIQILSTLGMVMLGVAFVLLVRHRPPAVLLVYAISISAILFTSVPIGFRPRMVMVIFPVFIGFGVAVRRWWAFGALLVASAASAAAIAWVVADSRILTP